MSGLSQNIQRFKKDRIRLSIVSHDQDELVYDLLNSIERHCQVDSFAVTVTRNTLSKPFFQFDSYTFPVHIIQNSKRKGFGANHNQAFATCKEEYFCVLNPDILIVVDPFPQLLSALRSEKVGVVGPMLYDSQGMLQDSARKFPTPSRILKKVINKQHNAFLFESVSNDFSHEWIAGMFMLFPSRTFQHIGGFDEKFFLYYEDADICKRLFDEKYKMKRVQEALAVHDARRSSHRSVKYMYWHLSSMFRFFIRYPFFSI